ncbi:MAG: hypothetical protein ACREHF_01560 [Rhizomicrobium sp.]
MARTFRIRARLLARVAAPVLFASALCACSSMPDWVDPTTWFGGGDQTTADQSSNGAAASDESATGQTPDLASIPSRPAPSSTPEEQKQVADSLVADRADAHYSADALRGGTEPSAPPPPPAAAAVPATGNSEAATGPDSESAAGAATQTAGSESADNSTSAAANEDTAAAAPVSQSAPSEAAPSAEKANPASGPTQVASTEPTAPVTPSPAAPMSSPAMQTAFAPSKAPALDPSVRQYVPAQILSQYEATAAEAESPGLESSASTSPSKHRRRHHKKAS